MKTTEKLTPLFLLSAFLFLGLASCSVDDKELSKAIHSVEATSEIDLSKYADKNCIVNSVKYSFVVEGNRLTTKSTPGGQVAYTDDEKFVITNMKLKQWVNQHFE